MERKAFTSHRSHRMIQHLASGVGVFDFVS